MSIKMFVPALFIAAACGGGGSSDDDDVVVIDSPPEAACTAPNSFGAVTPSSQQAVSDMSDGETTPDFFQLEAQLDTNDPADVMLIQFYKGFGAFATDYPTTLPATINITGDEAQFATCGACVLILGDIGADGMATGDPYLATGGTVTITAINGTTLSGSVSNLQFTRVAIDQDNNSSPSADGCESSVDAMDFSAAPVPQ